MWLCTMCCTIGEWRIISGGSSSCWWSWTCCVRVCYRWKGLMLFIGISGLRRCSLCPLCLGMIGGRCIVLVIWVVIRGSILISITIATTVGFIISWTYNQPECTNPSTATTHTYQVNTHFNKQTSTYWQ